MSKNPWMKFYPADWRADERLRMCSIAARGLWIEMLAVMHRASPYGYLIVEGHAPTDAQLSVLAGAPTEQVTDLIGELETAGVFSRTRENVIYSRRMVRDPKRFLPSSSRPSIPMHISRAVWRRDGRVCTYCCDDGAHEYHLDHIHPWSRGGEHSTKNLCVACRDCNLAKSDMTLGEWRFGCG